MSRAGVAAQAASYNALFQMFFRILSFLANGLLIRLVAPEILGIVFIRLTLLYTTIQFLSREPLRKVCLSSDHQWSHVTALVWISLPFSAALTVCLTGIWIYVLEAPLVPYYTLGCCVFGLSGFCQLLAEPAHLYLQRKLVIRAPIYVEGAAQLTQTALTLVLCHYSASLLPFIAGSFCYSIVYIVVYHLIYLYQAPDEPLTPPVLKTTPELIRLNNSFIKQCFLKQFLTEGEAFVMTMFPLLSFAEQGVFATISRLASIVMRVGFKNIEDSYYLFFAQMLHRGLPADQQGKDTVQGCREALGNLLRMMLLFGLVITVYGLSYAKLALLLYGGTALATGQAPVLLAWYCPYICACGINGVSECFFFATMAQVDVDQYNYKLVTFSFFFLLLSVLLSYWLGAVGFILANIANVVIRISYSMRYIEQFFGSSLLYRMMPLHKELLVIALSGGTCALSEYCLSGTFIGYTLHVIIGGLSLLLVLLVIWESEDNSFKLFIKSLIPRSKVE